MNRASMTLVAGSKNILWIDAYRNSNRNPKKEELDTCMLFQQ